MTSLLEFLKENAKTRSKDTFDISEKDYFTKNGRIDYKALREHYYFKIINLSNKYKDYIGEDLEETLSISYSVLIRESRKYKFNYVCFGNYLGLILTHEFYNIKKGKSKVIRNKENLEFDEFLSRLRSSNYFEISPKDINTENIDVYLRLHKLFQKTLDFCKSPVMKKRINFILNVYGKMMINPDEDFHELMKNYAKSSGTSIKTILKWHKDLSSFIHDVITDKV